MENKEMPLIYCFTYKGNYFVYDTNKNKLMSVSRELYIELQKLKKGGITNYLLEEKESTAHNIIVQLIDKGYFSASNVNKIEFPYMEYSYDLLNNNLGKLILQVTKDCNFNCRYCAYAANGEYDRIHEKKHMDFQVAKLAIDLLSKASKDTNKVYITFYGGEPFLEFDLIKKCVSYANSTIKTKDIYFNSTTNASILNDDIIKFLEETSFDLLISLDGPANIQNNNRRFKNTGKGSYNAVIKNIKNLMVNHKKYFDEHVMFNCVLLSDKSLNEVEDYFKNELKIPDNKLKIQRADLSGMDYLQEIDNGYLGKSTLDASSSIMYDQILGYTNFYDVFMKNSVISPIWQHNGPCFPGVQRLFVTCEGDFFPCEKAFEKLKCLNIGNLSNGFDLDQIEKLLSIGQLSENNCKLCWAKRFCNICAIKCVDFEKDILSPEKKEEMCKQVKLRTIYNLKKFIEKEMTLK